MYPKMFQYQWGFLQVQEGEEVGYLTLSRAVAEAETLAGGACWMLSRGVAEAETLAEGGYWVQYRDVGEVEEMAVEVDCWMQYKDVEEPVVVDPMVVAED
jgi:hypothetical protein